MIRAILEGSVLIQFLRKLPKWYHMWAIAHFFQAIRDAYPATQ